MAVLWPMPTPPVGGTAARTFGGACSDDQSSSSAHICTKEAMVVVDHAFDHAEFDGFGSGV